MTQITITALKAAGWTLDPVRGYVSPSGAMRVRVVRDGWMAHGSNEKLTIWCAVKTMEDLAAIVEQLRGALA